MTSFNVITYNVKGIQQKAKRTKIFNYVNNKIGSGIAFFKNVTPLLIARITGRNPGMAKCFSRTALATLLVALSHSLKA